MTYVVVVMLQEGRPVRESDVLLILVTIFLADHPTSFHSLLRRVRNRVCFVSTGLLPVIKDHLQTRQCKDRWVVRRDHIRNYQRGYPCWSLG